MAKKVFMEKKKLFTAKMNLELKNRIMKMLGLECSTMCSTDTTFFDIEYLTNNTK